MTPKKSEWMQIVESDNSSRNVKKVNKSLTLGTLASVGAIVIAGSLFANANNEPSAVADITSVASSTPIAQNTNTQNTKTQNSIATPKVSKIQAPAIAQLPKGGEDDDDEYEDYENRGERGEHRDRSEGDEDYEDGDDD